MTTWDVQLKAWFTTIQLVPKIAMDHWPTWFAFAATEMVSGLVLGMVPRVGGLGGTVVDAAVHGAQKSVQFATWEAFSVHAPVKS